MSIDDSELGYDIRSYDFEPTIQTIFIEVKGCSDGLSIFVTRNEWMRAIELGDRYRFHIWDLSNNTLHELSVESLPHIYPSIEGGVTGPTLGST